MGEVDQTSIYLGSTIGYIRFPGVPLDCNQEFSEEENDDSGPGSAVW